jgi:hypothetical protein
VRPFRRARSSSFGSKRSPLNFARKSSAGAGSVRDNSESNRSRVIAVFQARASGTGSGCVQLPDVNPFAHAGVGTCSDAHLHARVFFLRPMRAASCAGHSISATSSPQCCRTDASHVASHGLIWPKDVCASIACAAMATVRLSSPGLRPFLARAKKVSPPPSSAAL